uniref:NADH-ubiquinone oxidoreductase chain 4L n=1 Tax=Chthonerpeton indistinctum TaxID=420416 RepID=W5RHI5_CHTIN|nr:NADH dehydrogenase subunit 4L [Chthonerpeton indistinctum]AGZ18924.1 NADH dehydrogenase subunit 4L [Chthonerpeton indistinctum]
MPLMNFSICAAFTLGLMGLVIHRMHLLSALICLEGIMLSLFVGLALWTTLTNSTPFLIAPLALLTMSACEAGVGLSIMVATSRTHGTDLMHNMNTLRC